MAGALRQSVDTLRSVLRFEPVETDPVARRLRQVRERRRHAAHRAPPGAPRGVFDYVDGGAEDERTLRANSADFGDIGFRPRILRDVADVDPSTTLLGRPLPIPMVFSPTGFTRILLTRGRARGGPGRRPGRAAVHAVDPRDPVDRGGRGGERRGRSGSRSTCGATVGSCRS